MGPFRYFIVKAGAISLLDVRVNETESREIGLYSWLTIALYHKVNDIDVRKLAIQSASGI